MFLREIKSILLILFSLLFISTGLSQNTQTERDKQTLEKGIRILREYCQENSNWQVVQPGVENKVKGLVHFIEDESIDNIIEYLNKARLDSVNIVTRQPDNVEDSLSVPGYLSALNVKKGKEQVGIECQSDFQKTGVIIPLSLVSKAREEAEIIPEGKGIQLFMDSVYIMPDSLIIPEVIPDSVLNTPEQFARLIKTDSVRTGYIEEKRLHYNDSVQQAHVEFVVAEYRRQKFEEELNRRIKRYGDSVNINNQIVLKLYNDSVVSVVNDSIRSIIETLTLYADFIDTVRVSMVNLTGETSDILLQNGNERFSRVWLKNEQNDSLRVMVKNTDKRTIQMLIDDGVTFSRIKEKQTKDFDFALLEKEISDFTEVGKSYELETPWRIGGDGSLGFTQTYLENWKKGGKSALSSLMVLKGFVNYSRADGKVKWENTGEIRNGMIRPGGKESELQKNDDKFEITSRYGISAFKKWYYSAEFNFNTQLFRGYNYPKADNPKPISAIFAPSKTYFKVGLDYKPNKDVSLFLSPLTIKNVYVRDTTLVDQTNFGVATDKKSFWEPGLNADLRFRTNITEDITYETKYKMFINYQEPFKKFDINWENLLKMRLTDYIDMSMMVHLIYDDDMLFPVLDGNDVPVLDNNGKPKQKPMLQIKELITVGFSYKINRKVMRTHRIR
ncbi:MAG: DUF3078 domain-containing protein [Bacteroidota bacterium]